MLTNDELRIAAEAAERWPAGSGTETWGYDAHGSKVRSSRPETEIIGACVYG